MKPCSQRRLTRIVRATSSMVCRAFVIFDRLSRGQAFVSGGFGSGIQCEKETSSSLMHVLPHHRAPLLSDQSRMSIPRRAPARIFFDRQSARNAPVFGAVSIGFQSDIFRHQSRG